MKISFEVNVIKKLFKKYVFNVSVGGGSAGSAVAARLAEDYRVLLLEAGGDPHPLSYIPIANPVLLGQPIVDWEYFTEPLNNSGFAFIDQVS